MPNEFNPTELSLLAASLQRVAETRETSQWLWSNSTRFTSEWKARGQVTAREIPLPLPRRKGLIPSAGELEGVYLSFVFQCGEEEHFPHRADFQILVRGSLVSSTAMFELEDHWRVDTHSEDSGAIGDVPHEVHPNFHFQRGGHALDHFAQHDTFLPGTSQKIVDEWRGALQCEWPRMPALPMDPIVGIDFCIGQANGAVWNRLRNVPEYFSLVEQAQTRVWHPFFNSLTERTFRKRWLGEFVI